MLKSLIAPDFPVWGELEKFFTLSFPMRQGKYRGATLPACAQTCFRYRLCGSLLGARSTAMPRPSDLKAEAIEAGIGLDRDLAPEALFERT